MKQTWWKAHLPVEPPKMRACTGHSCMQPKQVRASSSYWLTWKSQQWTWSSIGGKGFWSKKSTRPKVAHLFINWFRSKVWASLVQPFLCLDWSCSFLELEDNTDGFLNCASLWFYIASDQCIQEIRAQLYEYRRLHEKCLDLEALLLPSRVLDLGTTYEVMNPNLHISISGERGHYTTLSYG
jgi:hypothetical protein